jgi:hypothetical protein
MIFFLFGFVCLLLVIGYLIGKSPVGFAVQSIVVISAVVFVFVCLVVGYYIFK